MTQKEQASETRLYESLSALMDGEASELEIRRILKSDDVELLSKWERYQLVRTALQGELDYHESIDLSDSIAEAIADEPAHSVKPKQSSSKRFWPNFSRFAVAASVAGAVVVGVQLTSVNTAVNIADTQPQAPAPAAGSPILNNGDASVSVVSNQPGNQPEPEAIIINEATQQQLQQMEGEINRLMLEHAQNASQNTQQGVLPYMRVPDSEQ